MTPECCSNSPAVDVTTLDPSKGGFTAAQPGLWRFTFQGVVQVATGQGVVGLYVNDAAKAVSEIAPGVNAVAGLYQISLNTLVELEAGDDVEIRWGGAGDAVLYSQAVGVHWTGMHLGSSLGSGALATSSLLSTLCICLLSSLVPLGLQL